MKTRSIKTLKKKPLILANGIGGAYPMSQAARTKDKAISRPCCRQHIHSHHWLDDAP
jgi:hypothetical protein